MIFNGAIIFVFVSHRRFGKISEVTKYQVLGVHDILKAMVKHLPGQIAVLALNADTTNILKEYAQDARVFERKMDKDNVEEHMFGRFKPKLAKHDT